MSCKSQDLLMFAAYQKVNPPTQNLKKPPKGRHQLGVPARTLSVALVLLAGNRQSKPGTCSNRWSGSFVRGDYSSVTRGS